MFSSTFDVRPISIVRRDRIPPIFKTLSCYYKISSIQYIMEDVLLSFCSSLAPCALILYVFFVLLSPPLPLIRICPLALPALPQPPSEDCGACRGRQANPLYIEDLLVDLELFLLLFFFRCLVTGHQRRRRAYRLTSRFTTHEPFVDSRAVRGARLGLRCRGGFPPRRERRQNVLQLLIVRYGQGTGGCKGC